MRPQGEPPPPPADCQMFLGVYADGYHPRGRGTINTKICILDEHGGLFPRQQNLPRCSMMLAWREMLKEAYENWVKEGRPVEFNTLNGASFSLPIRWEGKQYKTVVRIHFRFVTADHHHLWWECGSRFCVACPWQRHERILFSTNPIPCRLLAVDLLVCKGCRTPALCSQPFTIQRGLSVGSCGVVGQLLPVDNACVLHQYVCAVAPRYRLSDLPHQSKQYHSQVRRTFRSGVSFTRREARVHWLHRTASCLCRTICCFCRGATFCFSCIPPPLTSLKCHGGCGARYMCIWSI